MILTKNSAMLIMFNPYYSNNKEAAELLITAMTNGQMPRILPSGILLIAMCSGYSLVKALTSSHPIKGFWFAGLYALYTLFLFTTGTRGFVLVSALVLIFSLYSIRRVIKFSKLILLLPIIPLGVATLVLIVLRNNMFSTLINRTLEWQKSGYYDSGIIGRWNQSTKAIHYIISTPFGIGVPRPLDLPSTIKSGMWDVHGVLAVGLLGGIPAIIFLLWFLFKLYMKYIKAAVTTDILACGAALFYVMCLTMFNFTSAFTSSENLLAFSLFAGYLLSNKIYLDTEVSTDIIESSAVGGEDSLCFGTQTIDNG